MALSNGTYNISATNTGTATTIFLEFSTGGAGVNLTGWKASGSTAQQWEILSSSLESNTYTIKNSGTKEYVAWNGTLPPATDSGYYIVSDPSATTWYIRQGPLGHLVSPDNTFNYTWNVPRQSTADNTAMIVWPLGDEASANWNSFVNFTLIQAATSTTSPSTPSGITTGSTATGNGSTRIIVGASVGSGVGAIAILVIAYLQAHNLWYLLSSLGFNLFGWWLFRRRRLNFFSDKDLGQVEISLFFSNQETVGVPEDASLLVWQVFRIGHSRRGFTVSVPCIRGSGGQPTLGFGTVIDHQRPDKQWIESDSFEKAPAVWNGTEWSQLESEGKKTVFKNEHVAKTDIALGTYDTLEGGTVLFRPFLRLNDIEPGCSHEVGTNLYIHAFVTHGYDDGRYGKNLLADVMEDMLTKPGTKLADLKPNTHWHLMKVDGKITLKVKGIKEESKA